MCKLKIGEGVSSILYPELTLLLIVKDCTFLVKSYYSVGYEEVRNTSK